jgi:hypothetical protein
MKKVVRSDKPVTLLLFFWSHKCDFGAEPRSRIIATSAVKVLTHSPPLYSPLPSPPPHPPTHAHTHTHTHTHTHKPFLVVILQAICKRHSLTHIFHEPCLAACVFESQISEWKVTRHTQRLIIDFAFWEILCESKVVERTQLTQSNKTPRLSHWTNLLPTLHVLILSRCEVGNTNITNQYRMNLS